MSSISFSPGGKSACLQTPGHGAGGGGVELAGGEQGVELGQEAVLVLRKARFERDDVRGVIGPENSHLQVQILDSTGIWRL